MERRQRDGYIRRGSDYYRPAPTPSQSTVQATAPATHQRRIRSKPSPKKIILIAGPLVALLLIGILAFTFSGKSPLPASIDEQLTFAAYLPAEADGIVIDQTSYAWQEGVLTYRVQTPSREQIFVSQQLIPKEFDLTTFLQRIKSKQTLTNKFGQGQAGIAENNLVVSQVIGDTWIFMSAPKTIDPLEVGQVFQSIRKY